MKQSSVLKLLVISGSLIFSGCTTTDIKNTDITHIFELKNTSNEQVSHWKTLKGQPDIPPFKKKIHSDGCSGGMSAIYSRSTFLHKKYGKKLPWRSCCEIHDKAYYYGGSKKEKKEADEKLKQCVNDNQDGVLLGHLMQAAVTPFGKPQLHTSYRWGYGEDFRVNPVTSDPKNKELSKKVCEKVTNPEGSSREVKFFWVGLNNLYKEDVNRKLLVFMDGTTNNKASDTNIWQLYKKSLEQACSGSPVIPYYVKGLGTDWHDFATGRTAGLGSDKKIREAYSFLAQTYKEGDEIFLFGFSRGAFTARSLNGMLEYVGLLKLDSSYEHLFFDASLNNQIENLYKSYNKPHDGRQSFLKTLQTDIDNFKKAERINTYNVTVSAIGVFDTVPALGEEFNFDLRSLSSGTFVYHDPSAHRTDLYALKGFHAMSIDEQRTAFQLLRFRNYSNHYLEEVWFAGGHENIGGQNASGVGSDKAEIDQGLSKISLNWMVKKFEEYKIFPATGTSSPCKYNGENCEKGKLWDDFLYPPHYNLAWEKGRMLRRWPKNSDLVHGSVFCRRNIQNLKGNEDLREKGANYKPENLKEAKFYNTDEKYSSTVKYDCVN